MDGIATVGPQKYLSSAVLVRKYVTLCYCGERLSSLRLLGSFLPITLEQLARERGVLLSDKSKPCSASFHITQPSALGKSSLPLTMRTVSASPVDAGPCVIHLLGVEINTASFALYTFSLSVFVQAILIISMSGAADHGRYRKSLLLSFAFTGALATMLFLASVPRVYVLSALLAVISNTCFGASFVLLNSFLPLLVRHHPSVQGNNIDDEEQSEEDARDEEPLERENGDLDGSTQALLGLSHAPQRNPQQSATNGQVANSILRHPSKVSASPELQLSTKISSYGIGIGYTAGILVQILAIGIIILTSSISDSSNLAFRIVLFFIGLWWFCFTIPAALWLRPRPGPPIPLTKEGKQGRTWFGYIDYAWRSLGKTILRAGRLRDILLFLGSWFMISDSIATVSGTAVLFAKTELKMKVSIHPEVEVGALADRKAAHLPCVDQCDCNTVWCAWRFHLEQNLTMVQCSSISDYRSMHLHV